MTEEKNSVLGQRPHHVAVLEVIIKQLLPLDTDDRTRIIKTVCTFLNIEPATAQLSSGQPLFGSSRANSPQPMRFTQQESTQTPKEFLLQKQPKSDVERVACLAYYLTHFRDTPHFRTLDISKLNTETAQPKFANAANSVSNALRMGYLVPAARGSRQLSASGELFVAALPDREAAKQSFIGSRPNRRKMKRSQAGSIVSEVEGIDET